MSRLRTVNWLRSFWFFFVVSRLEKNSISKCEVRSFHPLAGLLFSSYLNLLCTQHLQEYQQKHGLAWSSLES